MGTGHRAQGAGHRAQGAGRRAQGTENKPFTLNVNNLKDFQN
jgi:hypothetical protein